MEHAQQERTVQEVDVLAHHLQLAEASLDNARRTLGEYNFLGVYMELRFAGIELPEAEILLDNTIKLT
jgi:hypothetical protein